MKNPNYFILFLTLIIQSINHAMADEDEFLMLQYNIFSEGEDVGDITLKLSRNGGGHVIAEHSHIKTSGWWGTIDIRGNLVERFSKENDLVISDSKIQDGDTAHWVKMEAYQDALWGSYAEVKDLSAQEEEKLVGLALAITSTLAPDVGEILSLSGALFANRKVQPQGAQFKRDSFNTTLNNLAFFIQGWEDKKLPGTLNLLDTENMEIIQVQLDDLGTEITSIGSKSIQTRHLKLSDSRFKPSHIWIAERFLSLPFVVRHTAEDEDGTFEIVLKPELLKNLLNKTTSSQKMSVH